MIDTVAIYVDAPDFLVLDPEKFRRRTELPYGGIQRSQNVTASERARRPGMPALKWTTGRPGSSGDELRIEMSAPKLFFGQNLNELAEGDLDAFLMKLQGVLGLMGVDVTPEGLRKGRVSKVHVGKNVILPPGMACVDAIRELERLGKAGHRDPERTDYQGGGSLLRYHGNSVESAFYDKLADIAKSSRSPKRAQDPLSGALGIPRTMKSDLSVLRMECRLNARKAVRGALKVATVKPGPTLEDVFKEEVAMGILLRELHRFEAGGTPRSTPGAEPLDAFSDLLNNGVKLPKALQMLAMSLLLKDSTWEEVRSVLRARGVSRERACRLRRVGGVTSSAGGEVLPLLKKALNDYQPFRP